MSILSNPRHERFAQLLAQGRSQIEAHAGAGYKPHRGNASSLAQDKNILGRVAELLDAREKQHGQATAKAIERVSLTKEWILARLVENAERAMQAVPVLDREGNETGEYTYQGNVANRSLELLGKEIGMFIERREVGEPGEFAAVADADLERELMQQALDMGLNFAQVSETQH